MHDRPEKVRVMHKKRSNQYMTDKKRDESCIERNLIYPCRQEIE